MKRVPVNRSDEKRYTPASHVDERTAKYYASRAEAIVAEYSTVLSPMELIKAYLPEHGSVLDIGSGSGRELLWFHAKGHEVQGAEPAGEMAAASQKLHPELAGRIEVTGLPELRGIEGPFDIILCNAVFQHLPDSQLFDSFFTICRFMGEEGCFILSVPLTYPGIDENSHRDPNGRYFKLRSAEEYVFLAERIGFQLQHRYESSDSLGRPGVTWVTLIFGRSENEGRRPIEKIESVIREDRKTNTYKFALLRALGEIAVTTPHAARWIHNSSYVAVNLDYVAEKWLEYYWPIMEGASEILQGAKSADKVDITFRKPLTELITQWSSARGGLGTFKQAWLQGELSPELHSQVRTLLGKIKQGIRQPIRYAGTSEKIFDYKDGEILVEQSLWREFALMGRWFEDSIILQWAQFSAGLKGNQQKDITASQLIDTVFNSIEEKRDTVFARQVFGESESLHCVWSGRPLSSRKNLAVDHVIPFSLWHNNNLWNLMPADAKVNLQKSDKLPTRALLNARAPELRTNWELLYERYRSRFSLEAQRFMGVSNFKGGKDSFDDLFRVFTEAVEVTALQRSVPRWEPA